MSSCRQTTKYQSVRNPSYISNISNELAAKATAYQVSETVEKIKDEYGSILDLSGIWQEVKQKFDFTSVPSADEFKEKYRLYL